MQFAHYKILKFNNGFRLIMDFPYKLITSCRQGHHQLSSRSSPAVVKVNHHLTAIYLRSTHIFPYTGRTLLLTSRSNQLPATQQMAPLETTYRLVLVDGDLFDLCLVMRLPRGVHNVQGRQTNGGGRKHKVYVGRRKLKKPIKHSECSIPSCNAQRYF